MEPQGGWALAKANCSPRLCRDRIWIFCPPSLASPPRCPRPALPHLRTGSLCPLGGWGPSFCKKQWGRWGGVREAPQSRGLVSTCLGRSGMGVIRPESHCHSQHRPPPAPHPAPHPQGQRFSEALAKPSPGGFARRPRPPRSPCTATQTALNRLGCLAGGGQSAG